MSDEGDFITYRIQDLRLKVELWNAWPVESVLQGDQSIIFQRIADTTGLVFFRYGTNETIPEFMKTVTDLITTVEGVREEVTTVAGTEARRVTFTQTRSSVGVHRLDDNRGYVHERLPATREFNSVLSFSHNGINVLFGFRVPEENYATYEVILERIINSVSRDDDR